MFALFLTIDSLLLIRSLSDFDSKDCVPGERSGCVPSLFGTQVYTDRSKSIDFFCFQEGNAR